MVLLGGGVLSSGMALSPLNSVDVTYSGEYSTGRARCQRADLPLGRLPNLPDGPIPWGGGVPADFAGFVDTS